MHVIRLRGPWNFQVLTHLERDDTGNIRQDSSELPAGRVQMPADWGESLGNDFRGRVRYQRRFNRPTGLDHGQIVYVSCAAVDCFGEVSLNGTTLGRIVGERTDQRFLVTKLLQSANELSIVVELPRDDPNSSPLPRPAGRENLPGGLIGEVRLEIEER